MAPCRLITAATADGAYLALQLPGYACQNAAASPLFIHRQRFATHCNRTIFDFIFAPVPT